MLKGIKFKQQKPDIKPDLDFLLESSDKKYVPQSSQKLKLNIFLKNIEKWKKEKPEENPEENLPEKKLVDPKDLKNMAQDIWDNFLNSKIYTKSKFKCFFR